MLGLTCRLCFSLMLFVGLVWIPADIISGQTPENKTKGTGSISGKVTIGGKATAGVVVAAVGNDMMNIRRGSATAQASTDSEGHYRLFGLAAAQYRVTALAPSLTAAEQTNMAQFDPFGGVGKVIVLAPGESVDDVDIKLVRGGVITGRVTNAEGKAIIDEHVILEIVDQNGVPRQQVTTSANYQMYQTDDRGIYRIYGLPAGRYKVHVGTGPNASQIGLGRNPYLLTYAPDTPEAAKATIIEIGEGTEATNVDILVGGRGQSYTASGRIVDADTGKPVVGVRVSYGPMRKDQGFFGGYIGLPNTNPNGEFRIEGLQSGSYGVAVSSAYDGGDFYSDPVLFEVTDHDVANLEIKAVQGLTLSGFVVLEGATNRNLLAQITNLKISANIASGTKPLTANGGMSAIAGDGSFQISGLRPGKAGFYVYSQASPNLRNFSVIRIERDGSDVSQGLELQPGQSITNLRVVLGYGNGTIRGTVKIENGSLPPNTRLMIRGRREGSSLPSANIGAQCDSRGHFVISNLIAGTYDLTLQVAMIPPAPGSRPGAPMQQRQIVTVAEDGEVEVTFTLDLKPKEIAQ